MTAKRRRHLQRKAWSLLGIAVTVDRYVQQLIHALNSHYTFQTYKAMVAPFQNPAAHGLKVFHIPVQSKTIGSAKAHPDHGLDGDLYVNIDDGSFVQLRVSLKLGSYNQSGYFDKFAELDGSWEQVSLAETELAELGKLLDHYDRGDQTVDDAAELAKNIERLHGFKEEQ